MNWFRIQRRIRARRPGEPERPPEEHWVLIDSETGTVEPERHHTYESAVALRKVWEDAYDEVLGSLLEAELLDTPTEDELKWFDTEDAKLSTKKRKSLPEKSFCGPNRSFPTHDCAHVRAAARLLNRAKVSSATKAKIRSCIARKNKSMSCGVNMGGKESS